MLRITEIPLLALDLRRSDVQSNETHQNDYSFTFTHLFVNWSYLNIYYVHGSSHIKRTTQYIGTDNCDD